MLKKVEYNLFTPTSLILVGICWCFLTYGGLVSKIFLPSPSQVLGAALELWQDGTLLSYTLDSLYRVGVGFLLAAFLAIPLGILMGSSKLAEAILEPLIDFVRYLPVTALVPLLILYFGIGDLQKMSVIFIGTFFQLVLLIADVTANISKDLIRAAYTLGANRWQVFRRVLLPAAMPGIIDNLRITMGWAWTYLVVAELVAANSGLGYMILKAQRFLQTEKIFLGLIIIGILGIITDYLFKLFFKLYLPWSEKVGGSR